MTTESRHILIAEDDVGMAELFSIGLTERGYQCQVVHSAEDCLNRVSMSRPDLLLLDYALPEMQGAALVEQLACAGNLPPFLVITGHGDERVAVRMMKLGARDYLVKDALLLDRLPVTVSRVFQELENERRLAAAEMALRESTALLQLQFANSPDIILILDRDYRIVRINQVRAGDFTTEGLVGQDGIAILPQEYQVPVRQKIDDCFESGVVQQLEHGIGDGKWVRARIARLPDEGQVRRVMIISTDITGERARAGEIAALLSTVQQEKERLSALVNSITDEVWLTDTEGRFTLANPAALREFNLSEGKEPDIEALARSLEVFRPDGTPRPLDEAPPLRALTGEIVRNQEEMVRTPLNGEIRYRQVNSAPVRDTTGKIIGAVSVVRDVTESKEAEARMRQQVEELRRWHDVTLGRESRILELKREVNDLLARAGLVPRYASVTAAEPNADRHESASAKES
jgi:PAS domain S-box-containing protein